MTLTIPYGRGVGGGVGMGQSVSISQASFVRGVSHMFICLL